jgi:hypothetical protein
MMMAIQKEILVKLSDSSTRMDVALHFSLKKKRRNIAKRLRARCIIFSIPTRRNLEADPDYLNFDLHLNKTRSVLFQSAQQV